jgi:hypothetical protein
MVAPPARDLLMKGRAEGRLEERPMRYRPWGYAVLALAIQSVACVSPAAPPAEEQPAPAPTVPSDADFRGVYTPATDDGPIAAIAFAPNGSYLMMPHGCAGEGCAELGTYKLSDTKAKVSLTDTKTGATRELTVEVLSTAKPKPASSDVKPALYLDPYGYGGFGFYRPPSASSVLLGAGMSLLTNVILNVMFGNQRMSSAFGPDGYYPPFTSRYVPQYGEPPPPFYIDCRFDMPDPYTTYDDAAEYWAQCPRGPLTPY